MNQVIHTIKDSDGDNNREYTSLCGIEVRHMHDPYNRDWRGPIALHTGSNATCLACQIIHRLGAED